MNQEIWDIVFRVRNRLLSIDGLDELPLSDEGQI
jgi:hypothetical protein